MQQDLLFGFYFLNVVYMSSLLFSLLSKLFLFFFVLTQNDDTRVLLYNALLLLATGLHVNSKPLLLYM